MPVIQGLNMWQGWDQQSHFAEMNQGVMGWTVFPIYSYIGEQYIFIFIFNNIFNNIFIYSPNSYIDTLTPQRDTRDNSSLVHGGKLMWGHCKKVADYEPWREPSPEILRRLGRGLPASRTVRNQCTLLKPHSPWHFVLTALTDACKGLGKAHVSYVQHSTPTKDKGQWRLNAW